MKEYIQTQDQHLINLNIRLKKFLFFEKFFNVIK